MPNTGPSVELHLITFRFFPALAGCFMGKRNAPGCGSVEWEFGAWSTVTRQSVRAVVTAVLGNREKRCGTRSAET
jgi:hypothetical protein